MITTYYGQVLGGSVSGVTQAAFDALAASIPQPANVLPKSEMTGGAIGTQAARYALEDHQHNRLTSTTYATVTSGNTVTIAFTRTFTNEPGMTYSEIGGDTSANAQPAAFKVQSWVTDANGVYTGAVIRVWRSQTLPQNLATLLLSAVYNLFNASVVGTRFSIIAVARSDVPST